MRNHIIAQHIAIEEALRSQHSSKHGAVIVKNGKIISSSRNQYCSFDRIGNFKARIWSIHAEMNALQGLPRSVTRGADMYVVRVSKKNHEYMNSKPCKICSSLIKKAGIRNVYYSTDTLDN